jgi:Abortive infection alpha
MPDPFTAALIKAGAAEPLQEFTSKLLGPARAEAGEMLADRVRFARYKAQVRLLERALEFTKRRGISPQQVPLRTLAPLIESASLEEDEALADMWAALLASAASGPNGAPPGFVAILRELSPIDARIMDLYRFVLEQAPKREGGFGVEGIAAMLELDESTVDLATDNLLRLGLLRYPTVVLEFASPPERKLLFHSKEVLGITTLGAEFLVACTPPDPPPPAIALPHGAFPE